MTEGKTAVNKRSKSRGNQCWLKLPRVRVIGSQLYDLSLFLYFMITILLSDSPVDSVQVYFLNVFLNLTSQLAQNRA